MTAALDAIRARHAAPDGFHVHPVCDWPCDAAQLLAALDRAEAVVAAARRMFATADGHLVDGVLLWNAEGLRAALVAYDGAGEPKRPKPLPESISPVPGADSTDDYALTREAALCAALDKVQQVAEDMREARVRAGWGSSLWEDQLRSAIAGSFTPAAEAAAALIRPTRISSVADWMMYAARLEARLSALRRVARRVVYWQENEGDIRAWPTASGLDALRAALAPTRTPTRWWTDEQVPNRPDKGDGRRYDDRGQPVEDPTMATEHILALDQARKEGYLAGKQEAVLTDDQRDDLMHMLGHIRAEDVCEDDWERRDRLFDLFSRSDGGTGLLSPPANHDDEEWVQP